MEPHSHTVSLSRSSADDGPKRALILAGGGMRVAYQAGVLRALSEAGLTFAHADGTSGGTINLAMLFSGHTPVEMCDRWRTLDVHDFVSLMPLHEYARAHDMPAMGDADGIIEKVFPHLAIDAARINAAQGMAGTFNVCNFTRKTNEAISHDRITRDLLVAGISLPVFMPPVAVGEDLYLDSVWIKDANLWEAVRRGAEELWLVWCIGNTAKYENGIFAQYVHMIELSANGGLFEEFDRIRALNARIEAGDSPFGQEQPIRLHVIKPEDPLPLDPDLYLGHIDTATLIDMGYADARRYLSTRTPGGVPFEPSVTQMNTAVPGLTIRETMQGSFVVGETDPEAGHERGNREGTHLAMHAAVTIRDMARFIDDPDHLGELTGHIDFTPFGDNIPASHGVFNLFSPTDAPETKYMVYELGFTHEGRDYYLAGKKEVRDDPGFDLWADTTTLFTRFHEGADASGAVVGAGILRLGVPDLVNLVKTMHATNTETAVDQMSVYAKFGRFFLGALWDSYAAFATAAE